MKKLLIKILGLVPQRGTPIDLQLGGGERVYSSSYPVARMEYNEYWRWVKTERNKKYY